MKKTLMKMRKCWQDSEPYPKDMKQDKLVPILENAYKK